VALFANTELGINHLEFVIQSTTHGVGALCTRIEVGGCSGWTRTSPISPSVCSKPTPPHAFVVQLAEPLLLLQRGQ